MSLIKRILFRKVILSVLVTIVILAILFFAVPQTDLLDSKNTRSVFGYGYGGIPGGGGGGLVGILSFAYLLDSQGKLRTESRAIAENAEAYLLLPQGTYCLLDGYPLVFIYIRPPEGLEVPPPEPDFGEFVSRYFNLGPDGATFEPPISLIFNYKDSMIPEGFTEDDMKIYRWDESLQEWTEVISYINKDDKTISCFISGFSGYAVIAVPEPEPEPEPEPPTEPEPTTEPEPVSTTEPEPTTEPLPIPTTVPEPTTEPDLQPDVESTVLPPYEVPYEAPDEDGGISQWLLAGIVFGAAVVIIILAVYLFWYRKILE